MQLGVARNRETETLSFHIICTLGVTVRATVFKDSRNEAYPQTFCVQRGYTPFS
jgi:hypothetical protein